MAIITFALLTILIVAVVSSLLGLLFAGEEPIPVYVQVEVIQFQRPAFCHRCRMVHEDGDCSQWED